MKLISNLSKTAIFLCPQSEHCEDVSFDSNITQKDLDLHGNMINNTCVM